MIEVSKATKSPSYSGPEELQEGGVERVSRGRLLVGI
jgi:hypothetical protein